MSFSFASFAVSVAVVLTAACGSKTPLPASPGSSSVAGAKDKCGWLAKGCPTSPSSPTSPTSPTSEDVDGCPEPLLAVGAECTLDADTAKKVGGIGQDMIDDADFTRVRLVAPTLACAGSIRARLEAMGIAEGRIQIAEEANRSYLSFEVAAWHGAECHH